MYIDTKSKRFACSFNLKISSVNYIFKILVYVVLLAFIETLRLK
jgi:hypothetical protein